MTRRYPDLKAKQRVRDSKIAMQIIRAWDIEKDAGKVFSIFQAKKKNLSDYRYWETLRTVWVVCGRLERVEEFKKLFSANRRYKYYFSTPEEAERLRQLDDVLTVYRACNEENDGGISWTLSKEYAQYYKESYQKEKIITRQVHKADVFALIERNAEEEILIL